MLTVPGSRMPPTEYDISETGPGSLPVDVLNYDWSYTNGNTHVRISGTVINNSDRSIHGVLLHATLYDQNGAPTAFGETYVTPTYLEPGQLGAFEFMATVKRSSGMKATRLVTVASPLAGF
jgi:hypothetical protein